jgi:uncharacterized protein (TIGR03000 family)
MRRRNLALLAVAGVLIGGVLVGWSLLSPSEGAEKSAVKLKVLLPEDETKVTIDGKATEGEGKERTLKATLKAGKDYFIVEARWEPNNYTKITRKRKVPAKDTDEVVVDLRKADPKQPDDIVVRFVPTPDDVVEAMCRVGRVGKDDIVFDLGCGDGRIVITAVAKFGAKRGVGIDLDEKLVKECKESARKQKVDKKVEFRQGDVLKIKDLSDATVVMLYMGDDINLRLRPILQKTLKPGARVVSHRFTMGDWKPTKTEKIDSTAGYECLVHLWEIKKKDDE